MASPSTFDSRASTLVGSDWSDRAPQRPSVQQDLPPPTLATVRFGQGSVCSPLNLTFQATSPLVGFVSSVDPYASLTIIIRSYTQPIPRPIKDPRLKYTSSTLMCLLRRGPSLERETGPRTPRTTVPPEHQAVPISGPMPSTFLQLQIGQRLSEAVSLTRVGGRFCPAKRFVPTVH